MSIRVPVALFVFNRPRETTAVLSEIRKMSPRQLLIVADGPRPGRKDDVERCAQVRRICREFVDWPCDLATEFSPVNLGCARRVSSGLDWAFSQAEKLIILEDDCLPDPTFFSFCEELLDRFAATPEVGQICGSTRYAAEVDTQYSYVFSKYGPIWGWASWRRAWRFYDFNMQSWQTREARWALRNACESGREYRIRSRLYDTLATRPFTWDYQWGYAKMVHGLLSIIPAKNLIENIGFGANATNTTAGAFGLPRCSISLPLCHPPAIGRDARFDRQYAEAFVGPPLWRRVIRRLLQHE